MSSQVVNGTGFEHILVHIPVPSHNPLLDTKSFKYPDSCGCMYLCRKNPAPIISSWEGGNMVHNDGDLNGKQVSVVHAISPTSCDSILSVPKCAIRNLTATEPFELVNFARPKVLKQSQKRGKEREAPDPLSQESIKTPPLPSTQDQKQTPRDRTRSSSEPLALSILNDNKTPFQSTQDGIKTNSPDNKGRVPQADIHQQWYVLYGSGERQRVAVQCSRRPKAACL
ncbi:hypothetical protein MMC10_000405 [Thelotrema lepadinum]|nr:hypothetical protein [Thelotrema lepadinum]